METLSKVIALAITGAIIAGAIGLLIVGYNTAKVYAAEATGKAEYARAEQNRRILVEQAKAEKEAAVLQAQAIEIMGAAAKAYPEYRQQEFISAFGQALRDGNVSQIIYVPTEANIPLTEAGRTAMQSLIGPAQQ